MMQIWLHPPNMRKPGASRKPVKGRLTLSTLIDFETGQARSSRGPTRLVQRDTGHCLGNLSLRPWYSKDVGIAIIKVWSRASVGEFGQKSLFAFILDEIVLSSTRQRV